MGNFKIDLNSEKIKAFKVEALKVLKRGAVFLTVIIAIGSILIVIDLHSSGRLLPRTEIAGIAMGYLKTDEAKGKLLIATDQYLKTPIIFNYQGQQVGLSPEELGIQLGVAQTLNTVPIFKSENQTVLNLIASLFSKREIPIQHSINLAKAVNALQAKLNLADKRAKNATMIFQDKNLVVTQQSPGIAIQEEKLKTDLEKSVATLNSDTLNILVENEQPNITAAQLNQEKDRLIALIQKPLTLVAENKKLGFKLVDHLDAVQFTQDTTLDLKNANGKNLNLPIALPGQDSVVSTDLGVKNNLKIKVRQDKMESFLVDKLLKNVEIPTSAVNISKDKNGNIVIDGKGEDGKSVPRNRLMDSIALAANNGIEQIQVPIVTEKAPVNISDDLKDLGIKDLIGTGHTSFYGSHPNRIHNIGVGIAKYNGLIVKPGETFSFNKILGPVDGSTGYLQEKVIKKNKVEMEFGGGICQVSSTAYRAALFAGLPIVERNPHSWLVSYYGQTLGPGLDATIYPGVSDVKFINDTPGNILIQSYAENYHAYFKFYGTSDGRTTKMDGPYGAHLNWKWFRLLTDKDGKETKETIISNYHTPPVDPPPAPPAPTPPPAVTPAPKPTTPAAKPATPAPKPKI